MKNQQVVFITGASSGIGLLTAKKLHDNGFKVFGTSRNPEKNKDKVPFELLPLDVNSDQSIKECVEILFSKTQTVDVLINNAGAALGGTAEETTIKQAQKHFDTNFWSAVKLTQAILPVMRKQRSGKIITTGSLSGLIGVPGISFYGAAKHALEGFYKALRYEVKSFNIKVTVIEPAFYKSNIDAAADRAPESIDDYNHLRNRIEEFIAKAMADATTPEPVADLVLKIIQTKEPKFSYKIGENSKFLPALQFLAPGMLEKSLVKMMKI